MAEQPTHRPALQDFVHWLRQEHAVSRQRSSHDSADLFDFIPTGAVRAYLATDGRLGRVLSDLLAEEERPDAQTRQNILNDYPVVFAILVEIGKGRFITRCVLLDALADDKLPFQQKPFRFPEDTDGVNDKGEDVFFAKFKEAQARFCAPVFRKRRGHRMDTDQIMPFLEKKLIGKGGSSKVYRVRIHTRHDALREGDTAGRESEHSLYALKSFEIGESQKWHDVEVKAFSKFGPTGLELTGMVGFYGSFVHRGIFHLLLEYADRDTLEAYIMAKEPPLTHDDIHSFWSGILKVLNAMATIHFTDPDPADSTFVYEGVHQDIKPQNILVKSKPNASSIYEFVFGLSDLGTSRYKKSLSAKATRDGHGTKAYGAPECFRADLYEDTANLRVTDKADIWSFGCILSELAVWVLFGRHGARGLDAYRERRLMMSGRKTRGPDCFHHKDKLSEIVIAEHKQLLSAGRCDPLTRRIVETLPKLLAADPQERSGARELRLEFIGILKDNTSVLEGAEPTPRSNGKRPVTSAATTQGSAVSPPMEPRLNKSLSQTSHQSASPPYFPIQPSRVLSQIERQTQTPQNTIFDEADLQQSFQKHKDAISDVRQFHTEPNETSIRPSSSPDIRTNQALAARRDDTQNQQSFLGRYGDHEPRSCASAATPNQGNRSHTSDDAHLLPLRGARPSSPEHEDVRRSNTGGASYGGEVWKSAVKPIVTSPPPPMVRPPSLRTGHPDRSDTGDPLSKPSSEQDSTHAAVSDLQKHVSPDRISSSDPRQRRNPPAELTFALASNYMNKTQYGQQHVDLPGREFLQQLEGRDHVFFVDDSSSMWDEYQRNHGFHKPNVRTLIKLLGWLTKNADPDGVDLQFFNSPTVKKKIKKSALLVDTVRATKFAGVSNPCTHLKKYLEKYRDQIIAFQKDPNRSSWKVFGGSKKPRPLSVYVLTDGVWESPNDNDMADGEYLDHTIVTLVEALVAAGFERDQLGIQFISFGKHAYGQARLNHLDCLNKTKNLSLDIVDTEPSDGNIWKMLLGAINSRFDGD